MRGVNIFCCRYEMSNNTKDSIYDKNKKADIPKDICFSGTLEGTRLHCALRR